MSIWDKVAGQTSAGIVTNEHRVVIVHDGTRGPQGFDGEKGDTGDQGDSIDVLGAWVAGATYCPNDAVSWRSSVVSNVSSLYVQRSDVICAPSTLEPNEDPGRWQEIGAVDWDNAFGGIWTVYQQDHGFTKVGQPVGYSYQSDSYVLAAPAQEDELAICVVREVVSDDQVILQTSGEVPNIDASVIYPDGSDWEPGRLYYVSSIRGRLSLTPPTDTQSYVNAILKATDVYAPGGGTPAGGRNGVALPYTPTGGPGTTDYVTVGWKKFFFTMVTSNVSGPDEYGNVLEYEPGVNMDVFQNGINLRPDQYGADNGTTVRIFLGQWEPGDRLEIWTPDRPLDVIVPSTAVKIDDFSGQFDGVKTSFFLQVNGAFVLTSSANNIQIWLDATNQEPLLDYTISTFNIIGVGDVSRVDFLAPPEAGTRFWGTVFIPVEDTAIAVFDAVSAVASLLYLKGLITTSDVEDLVKPFTVPTN